MVFTLSRWGSILFYFLVFFVSSNMAWRIKCDIKWLRILLLSFFPVLLGGLRHYVGADYGGYLLQFRDVVSSNISIASYLKTYDLINDPIGLFLVQKFAAIFNSSFLFFAITSALNYVPVVIYLCRDWDDSENGSKLLAYSLFTYLFSFYPFGFAAIKQGIAMSFCLLSLSYVYNRKFVKFIICILVAASFHSSALVFIPIYFLCSKTGIVTPWKKIAVISVAFIAIYEIDFIIQSVGGRYLTYLDSEVKGRNLIFWMYLFWCVIFLVFRKQLIASNHKNDLLIILFVIGTIFQILGFTDAFSKRIGEYFLISQTILLPQLLCVFSKKSRKLAWILIVVFQVAMFVLQYLVLDQSSIVPYSFVI